MNKKICYFTNGKVKRYIRLNFWVKTVVVFVNYFFLFSLYGLSQNLFNGRVVDAKTGEPIPYATVYVSESKGTLTNMEGKFSLDLMPKDSVSISFLGYGKLRFSAHDLPKVVKMESSATLMKEVTVVSPQNILKKVISKLDKEYRTKNSKSSNYFLRQTFVQESGRSEMVEAFMQASSNTNLRDIFFVSGKHYRMGDYSEVKTLFSASNLQHLFDFAPRVYENAFWSKIYVPLGFCIPSQKIASSSYYAGSQFSTDMYDYQSYDNYKKSLRYFDVRVEELSGEEGYYKISFARRDLALMVPIVVGTLYVQSKGYKLLGFEGRMLNMVLDTQKDFWKEINETEPIIRIGYTHEHKFTEVKYVACNLEAAQMKCRSIAYNLNERELKADKDHMVKMGDNMLDAVARAGYDSTLWKKTCILRTEEEERIAKEGSLAEDASPVEIANDSLRPTHDADYMTTAGNFQPLVERLRAFGRTIPQEKVYIHMDNTSYQLGDTIWFSAYTRRTDRALPSNVSGVLYVELYGQDGYMIERKLIQMHNGCGEGFFALNKMIQYAGLYELRAYTRWQLNWGIYERKHSPYAYMWFDSKELEHAYFKDYEKLYSRVFPVYDRPEQPGDFLRDITLRGKRRVFRKDKDKHELSLKLFPEGGGLVKGLPCHVAFEATWNDGEWANGWLYYGQDSVKVQNRGRGTFMVTPTEKKGQSVRFVSEEGTSVKANLPLADSIGVALHMQQTRMGRWTAHITPSANLRAESLGLTLMHEGRMLAFHRITELPSEQKSKTFAPNDSLLNASGVYQITVFDSKGRVYADRLFFVRKDTDTKPTLSIQGLKKAYAPYEAVDLHIKTLAGKGDVSLTVRDDNTRDFLYDNGSILTEMLLASEIRGFVPQPGWYFEKDDEEHRAGLDLLMMTQGWRRFRWQDMAIRGTWDLSQPAEQAPILKGRVYKYNWDVDYNIGTVLKPNLSFQSGKTQEEANSPIAGEKINGKQENPASIASTSDTKDEHKDDNKTKRKDRDYLLSRQYLKADKDVKLHAELVSTDGKEVMVNERATKDGRFQIQLPPFYGKALFFLSAADTTKWNKRMRKRYMWIQGEEYSLYGHDPNAPYNKFQKRRFDVQRADYMSRIQWHYPHFVNPYNHYQTIVMPMPTSGETLLAHDSENVHNLKEVFVQARRKGLRRYDDSQPILVIDMDEAANMTFDAGMYSFSRYMVGDYGLDYPFVTKNDSYGNLSKPQQTDNIEQRFGISPIRRMLPSYRDKLAKVPKDSLYARQYLISFPTIPSTEESVYYTTPYLEKMVFSTDYSPRMPSNWRYQGENLPVTTTVVCPSPDQNQRMTYRDRMYYLNGFAYPAEFYSPDYSKGKLPETPTDYRRTLYWNPHLKLDENGEASIRFYNCCRPTRPSVDAQGQTQEGALLWNE